MLKTLTSTFTSGTRSLFASIAVMLAVSPVSGQAEPMTAPSHSNQARSILISRPVSLAQPASDHDLIALDLQYEALVGEALDPQMSDCIAQRLGARWLLPASADESFDDDAHDQVVDAAANCRHLIRTKSTSDDPLVSRQVAEAVARPLSANAQARLRIDALKAKARTCLQRNSESEALQDCLKNVNAKLVEPGLLAKLLAISARWIN